MPTPPDEGASSAAELPPRHATMARSPGPRVTPSIAISHREFIAMMASCMAMAALSIDLMLPAFPDIRSEFGLAADSTRPAWVITAFFVGLAIGQLFYGPLSDRHGRKPLLHIGLALMAVSATAAAVAPSLSAVVVCRVVWGIGAAAPRSLALAMVRDVFTGDRMARTMSQIMATFVLVPVLAPGLGAAITIVAPWRALFLVPAAAAVSLAVWLRRLPETLAVERRRSMPPAALLIAAREVVRNPQTIGFLVALSCIFGIMSGYVGSSELIIDEVFGRADQYPLIFGLLAVFLAAGSYVNARVVMHVGLDVMLRFAACYLVGASALMASIALATAGKPPLWLFAVSMAVLLPVVATLTPNTNTAAMALVPHVAGTAAAVLGVVSTAGGALLGSVLDARFDGTIRPFACGVFLYGVVAAVSIIAIGLRPAHAPVIEQASSPQVLAAHD